MIDVKHVRKSFGEKVVLQDISSTMQTGKCNLIIGTSGSGKTVLMKILIGLFSARFGRDILRWKRHCDYGTRR